MNPKRQKAVAIKYDSDEIAPKILAKGAGVIAEKILENAKNSEIKIHKDAELVEDLTRLDLGEHIPPELYEAVAQILVFICELDSKVKNCQ
jgi:flagellar biosynthesis protein